MGNLCIYNVFSCIYIVCIFDIICGDLVVFLGVLVLIIHLLSI